MERAEVWVGTRCALRVGGAWARATSTKLNVLRAIKIKLHSKIFSFKVNHGVIVRRRESYSDRRAGNEMLVFFSGA
jgi:hypothetical protein